MKNNKLKLIVAGAVVLPLLVFGSLVLADQVTGTFGGTVITAPTASPVAGTYNSTQSVTLTASGSSSINYTTDGSTPTCSTGIVYPGAIFVSSSEVITAISCYPNDHHSSVVTFGYAIASVSSGGGGGGGGIINTNLTNNNNPAWNSTNVGISDLSIMMSEWGQMGSGLSADLNHDGNINILDFSILMADWNA